MKEGGERRRGGYGERGRKEKEEGGMGKDEIEESGELVGRKEKGEEE